MAESLVIIAVMFCLGCLVRHDLQRRIDHACRTWRLQGEPRGLIGARTYFKALIDDSHLNRTDLPALPSPHVSGRMNTSVSSHHSRTLVKRGAD